MDKDKNSGRKSVPKIDEDLMMSLMVDGINTDISSHGEIVDNETTLKEQPIDKSINKTKAKGKKNTEGGYEIIFFKKPETNARDGRVVYIRPEFHERLTRIVQVIGDDKISLYAYLDNLLEYHFQQFEEEIVNKFNDKYKPIM